jgi:hypothetical protein
MNEKIKIRMKKILALATRGVGGEQINAKIRLTNLLNRYGLTIDDIQDYKERSEYTIPYKTVNERIIILAIYQDLRPNVESFVHRRKNCVLELSKSEYVEFKLKYEIYRRELEKELEITFQAFMESQNLWPESWRDKAREDNAKPTQEQLELWVKAWERSMEIDELTIRRQIGESNGECAQ